MRLSNVKSAERRSSAVFSRAAIRSERASTHPGEEGERRKGRGLAASALPPVDEALLLPGRPWSRLADQPPAVQSGYLDQVAAGVVDDGDGRAGDFGRRRGELRAQRLHAVVLALHVVQLRRERGLTQVELAKRADVAKEHGYAA